MRYLSIDGKSMTDANVMVDGPDVNGNCTLYLVDKGGNMLNTQAVCIIFDRYHPWFKRFIEERFSGWRE